MDVRNRISYGTGCMMYKVINGMTPSYLNQLLNYVNNIHSLCTKKSKAGDSTLQSAILIMVEIGFNIKVVCYRNVILRNIRNANTFMSFKMNFKQDLKL